MFVSIQCRAARGVLALTERNLSLSQLIFLASMSACVECVIKQINCRLLCFAPGIVAEVTDDKQLPKETRKLRQVEHAPHASRKAKLVKLADKLYNLRDLQRATPVGWSRSRMLQYYEWTARVVAGLRGTNKQMEDALDELLRQENVL